MSRRPVDPNKCDIVVAVPNRWVQRRYSVDNSTTLKQLKQIIASDNYNVNPRRLIVHNITAGRKLMADEQKTLAQYGIQEGRTTQLDVTISAMSLNVGLRGCPASETFNILCNEYDTVEYLRHEIANAMRLRMANVRREDLVLYSGSQKLDEPEKFLGDYGVRETSVEFEVNKVAGRRVRRRTATSAL